MEVVILKGVGLHQDCANFAATSLSYFSGNKTVGETPPDRIKKVRVARGSQAQNYPSIMIPKCDKKSRKKFEPDAER